MWKQQLFGVEEGGEVGMSDEGGDRIDSEEEMAAPDWACEGPETNRHRRKEQSTKQHTYRSEPGAHIA